MEDATVRALKDAQDMGFELLHQLPNAEKQTGSKDRFTFMPALLNNTLTFLVHKELAVKLEALEWLQDRFYKMAIKNDEGFYMIYIY